MNTVFKILIILSMFFLFFDGWIIKIGDTSFLYIYILILYSFLGIYTIFNWKYIIKKTKFLYLKTPFKYLVYFLAWLFIDASILIITNKASILIFYYIIVKLILPTVICYMISAIFIPKYISIRNISKVLLMFMLIFIIFAIIGYIGDTYNISFIQTILNSFSNLKKLFFGIDTMSDYITGSARARGVFHEPGSFGKFILLFSPILYKICLSKYKIFKNKYFNKFYKYTMIPLSMFCVILTKSPMILIFFLGFLVCYFYKNIINFATKYYLIIICSLIGFIFIFPIFNIDLSHTYLYRIINTVSNIKSFDSIVILESSLASRIVSYVNTFIVFLHKPFLGYGYDNVRYYLTEQYLHSPLTLTRENREALYIGLTTNQGTGYNRSLLSGLLAETGLIGTFLYFLFLYKHMTYIDKLKPYFHGIERKFLEGIKISILVVIVLSFYIYSFATAYLYLYYGFVCSFVVQYYNDKRRSIKQ